MRKPVFLVLTLTLIGCTGEVSSVPEQDALAVRMIHNNAFSSAYEFEWHGHNCIFFGSGYKGGLWCEP